VWLLKLFAFLLTDAHLMASSPGQPG